MKEIQLFHNRIWIVGGVLLLAVILVLVVFTVYGDLSRPVITSTDTGTTAAAELKIWQDKEAPAYVPARRDTDVWRSVRMPPAESVEGLLRNQGKIPVNAPPDEIERAIQEWYRKAGKDAFFGPDPQAYQNLMARESALLNSDVRRRAG